MPGSGRAHSIPDTSVEQHWSQEVVASEWYLFVSQCFKADMSGPVASLLDTD